MSNRSGNIWLPDEATDCLQPDKNRRRIRIRRLAIVLSLCRGLNRRRDELFYSSAALCAWWTTLVHGSIVGQLCCIFVYGIAPSWW